MNIKQLSLALSVAAGAAFSASVLAQQAPLAPADITFVGTIQASVCTPELSGGGVTGPNTVTLPPATTAELATTGATAKETPFNIVVNCPTQLNGVTQFWAHFNATGPLSDGRFIATTGSTNVSFQLLDGDSGTDVVKAGDAAGTGGPGPDQGTGSPAFGGSPPSVTATKPYRVRYYAENGLTSADAGAVAADGTYTVYFY